MAAHHDVLPGIIAKRPRRRNEVFAVTSNPKHRHGRAEIEVTMQALDEVDANRIGQATGRMLGVDDLLESDVGTGLDLEITPRLIGIEFVGQRPLDVSEPGVVPLADGICRY